MWVRKEDASSLGSSSHEGDGLGKGSGLGLRILVLGVLDAGLIQVLETQGS